MAVKEVQTLDRDPPEILRKGPPSRYFTHKRYVPSHLYSVHFVSSCHVKEP